MPATSRRAAASQRWQRAAVGAAGATLLGLGYAGLVERRFLRLRHVTVPALRPAATRPVRVLHLSDLHAAPWQRRKLGFVAAALRTGPDVVVATGDLLGHPDAIDPVVDVLADAARGRLALAVLGSNDVYGPEPKNPARYLAGPSKPAGDRHLDTDRLVEGLRASGWHVLENRRVLLDSPAGPIDVAGLGDPHAGWDHPERLDWTPPDTPVALRLGLVHAPYLRALDAFDRGGYDLVLAGHTHGGQLRVPGLGALVDNCDLPLGQARGLSRHAGLWLHVTAGLGESVYAPVRFACPPEAGVLDLVPPAPADRS